MNYRFGPFTVDDTRRQLSRDGEPVVLAPRLFDALLFFVVNAGELLDKETLLDTLWPGVVVEENSLSQTVSALRRLLRRLGAGQSLSADRATAGIPLHRRR